MSTIVQEMGAMAASSVREILDSGQGSPAAPNPQLWSILSDGGWGSISSDLENGVELRDILEVARVSGRYPYSTPIVSTLLAGRWFELDDDQLESGIVPAVRRGAQVVAPYYSDGVAVVDGLGGIIAASPSAAEPFSLLSPLAVLPSSTTVLSEAHLGELRAAFLAVAVGCADAVIDASIAWSTTREQFGQPIKGFQAVRHHLANAHIAREQAWTAAIAAAHEPARSAAWARQGFALARTSIELGIQVHGGVGFTWEVGLHHYLNHIIELQSVLGDDQ
ncbi:hypothetical protein GY21_11145 [Cryobacterium roopkundense]|uniref:Acyl-CoA dehydrogenase/oxidase C-terminal domain-containing protein n=1 Tax=Cryobacterium roopkundense TaxID=1001240 RepID=A0A099J5V5_9MICO|nr:acyl-CoA dehydrogenase family protein [Cryobacterium roopkundense]KGJ73460.1 hypothetical protein GY21_11145 [Cryobacterium roopkundense]MBB5641024.1 hypothetical protein [Cryobacterium roopkundense]